MSKEEPGKDFESEEMKSNNDDASDERKPSPIKKDDDKINEADNETMPKSESEDITKPSDPSCMSNMKNTSRLPDKMMCILLNDLAPDAIWWLESGASFAMDKDKFQEEILDKYFRGNKFKSMIRNLHKW